MDCECKCVLGSNTQKPCLIPVAVNMYNDYVYTLVQYLRLKTDSDNDVEQYVWLRDYIKAKGVKYNIITQMKYKLLLIAIINSESIKTSIGRFRYLTVLVIGAIIAMPAAKP